MGRSDSCYPRPQAFRPAPNSCPSPTSSRTSRTRLTVRGNERRARNPTGSRKLNHPFGESGARSARCRRSADIDMRGSTGMGRNAAIAITELFARRPTPLDRSPGIRHQSSRRCVGFGFGTPSRHQTNRSRFRDVATWHCSNQHAASRKGTGTDRGRCSTPANRTAAGSTDSRPTRGGVAASSFWGRCLHPAHAPQLETYQLSRNAVSWPPCGVSRWTSVLASRCRRPSPRGCAGGHVRESVAVSPSPACCVSVKGGGQLEGHFDARVGRYSPRVHRGRIGVAATPLNRNGSVSPPRPTLCSTHVHRRAGSRLRGSRVSRPATPHRLPDTRAPRPAATMPHSGNLLHLTGCAVSRIMPACHVGSAQTQGGRTPCSLEATHGMRPKLSSCCLDASSLAKSAKAKGDDTPRNQNVTAHPAFLDHSFFFPQAVAVPIVWSRVRSHERLNQRMQCARGMCGPLAEHTSTPTLVRHTPVVWGHLLSVKNGLFS